MNKYLKQAVLFLLASSGIIGAEEAVCPRCEAIREYNKEHHKNYYYYEDYLKDQQSSTPAKPLIAEPQKG